MPEYETLRVIWWLLLGVLLIGFAVTDGFDLGVAALLRWLGRDDDERRAVLESIEPVWDGNQVWLILGAGAVFAAWPLLYAASFSGFYFAILLVLLAFIVRPVGFGFRNKINDPRWRDGWDWVLTVSGLIPPLIFGVAFGNLFLGVPFRYDETLRMTYEGGLIGLLRPFPLLVGVVSLTMLLMQGAAWASFKADEIIAARATRLLSWLAPAFAVTYILAGVWLAFGIPGLSIGGTAVFNGPSNPLVKEVTSNSGWLADGALGAWACAVAVIAIIAAVSVPLLARRGIHRELGRHRRHDPVGRLRAVSVPDAFEPGSAQQPDDLGCIEQPHDARPDADRDADLPADRAGLYGMGLQRAARSRLAGACEAVARNVLRNRIGETPCGTSAGYSVSVSPARSRS